MKEKILNSWSEIQEEFNKINPVNENGFYDSNKDFSIFRGQQEESWKISSTLERYDLKDSISTLIFEFKQKLNLFNTNKPENDLEILSLMRHYGIPSPLVDFSSSPYIALFFAFNGFLNDSFVVLSEDEKEKKRKKYDENFSAVFSLNRYILNSKSDDDNFKKYLTNSNKEFEKFWESDKKYIMAFMPEEYNQRISAQQGLFLSLSKNEKRSFNEVIKDDYTITKYKIPHKLAFQILYELNKMNINNSTLFPDLDGLGAHIGFKDKLRVLNNNLNFK